MAEQITDNDIQEFEEDVCGNIANLSASLSHLEEIDVGLMTKSKQEKVKQMRETIFNALVYYTDILKTITEDEG